MLVTNASIAGAVVTLPTNALLSRAKRRIPKDRADELGCFANDVVAIHTQRTIALQQAILMEIFSEPKQAIPATAKAQTKLSIAQGVEGTVTPRTLAMQELL